MGAELHSVYLLYLAQKYKYCHLMSDGCAELGELEELLSLYS